MSRVGEAERKFIHEETSVEAAEAGEAIEGEDAVVRSGGGLVVVLVVGVAVVSPPPEDSSMTEDREYLFTMSSRTLRNRRT